MNKSLRLTLLACSVVVIGTAYAGKVEWPKEIKVKITNKYNAPITVTATTARTSAATPEAIQPNNSQILLVTFNDEPAFNDGPTFTVRNFNDGRTIRTQRGPLPAVSGFFNKTSNITVNQDGWIEGLGTRLNPR